MLICEGEREGGEGGRGREKEGVREGGMDEETGHIIIYILPKRLTSVVCSPF